MDNDMHLVIGASGLVGSHLMGQLNKRQFPNCGTYHQSINRHNLLPLDIINRDQVFTLIKAVRPKFIYLTSAMTHVDLCESKPENSFAINVLGTKNVVDAAHQINSTVIFVSSDYVFDGMRGPYSESEACNPVNVYGRHKLAAENYVALNSENYMIARTCGVFGNDDKNFVTRLIKSLRSNKQVQIPDDQYGTPTYADDLANCLISYAVENLAGLVHITNRCSSGAVPADRSISRYQFAKTIAARLYNTTGATDLIIPVKTDELKQVAKRPMRSGLICDRLPTLQASLATYFKVYEDR